MSSSSQARDGVGLSKSLNNFTTMDKFTSKNVIRPVLTGIYFTKDKMVVTDSFRLIEVTKDIDLEGEARIIKAARFKGRGNVSISKDNLIKDGDKLIQGEA